MNPNESVRQATKLARKLKEYMIYGCNVEIVQEGDNIVTRLTKEQTARVNRIFSRSIVRLMRRMDTERGLDEE